jgi:DSF synthase
LAVDFRLRQTNTLWVTMTQAPIGRSQYFSLDLLNDFRTLLLSLRESGATWVANGSPQPIHYFVLASAHPDYFSQGGDLSHFRECIRQQDKQALRDYSMLCLDMMYELCTVLNQQATTVALVAGRALGGGFETALSADYIIAEEHSEFGFPEILFGLFPCTGGMSLLARRVGVYQAERMMRSGRTYTATELQTLGVIDEVCQKGQGQSAVDAFIAIHSRRRKAHLMLQRARARMTPLDYDEMRLVVDEWVDAATALEPDDLRVMDMLIKMQRGRVLT